MSDLKKDLKNLIHNDDHDPIESNYVSGENAYGRHRAKDGVFSYLFLPFTVALITSVGGSELWLAADLEAQTFSQMLKYQYMATGLACLFGARGLGRRLLAGFLVWCVFSVHIIVLASQGRINMSVLLDPYIDSKILEWLLSFVPFV